MRSRRSDRVSASIWIENWVICKGERLRQQSRSSRKVTPQAMTNPLLDLPRRVRHLAETIVRPPAEQSLARRHPAPCSRTLSHQYFWRPPSPRPVRLRIPESPRPTRAKMARISSGPGRRAAGLRRFSYRKKRCWACTVLPTAEIPAVAAVPRSSSERLLFRDLDFHKLQTYYVPQRSTAWVGHNRRFRAKELP